MQRRGVQPAELVDVKGDVRRHIAGALQALKAEDKLSDDQIHDARKALKRARASLRLLRDGVGKPSYVRENSQLRDAAQPLSRVRDAKVVLDTLQRMLAKEAQLWPRTELLRLRRVLRQEREQLRRELLGDAGKLSEVERSLEEAARRVGQWQPPRAAWPVLRAGIERIYLKGRKALAEAEANRSDPKLHEARKQVKYFGHAMAIFVAARADGFARLAKRAESVAEDLGDDHDLAMLQERIATLPAAPRRGDKALLAGIERRRRRLQRKALKDAKRLYRRKPKAFVNRVRSALVG